MIVQNSSMQWLWFSALMLWLDQTSKYLVTRVMSLYQLFPLGSFLNLLYVRNYGAAFSFLNSREGWQRWLFIAIAISASAFLIWCLKRNPVSRPVSSAGYTLIISGSLGNLLDRLMIGYVIDFMDFHWQSYHWPVFNIADSCIFIGATLLVIDSFLHPSPTKPKES